MPSRNELFDIKKTNLVENIYQLVQNFSNHIDIYNWQDWSPERIKNDFAQRSVNQIINEGDILYLDSCFNYTALMLEGLKENNIGQDHTLLIQVLNVEGHGNIPRVHFAADFKEGGESKYVDFEGGRKVILSQGSYLNANPKALNLIQPDILVPYSIDANIRILEQMGHHFNDIPQFDFKAQIAHMSNINNKEVFNNYLNQTGGKKDLQLELRF